MASVLDTLLTDRKKIEEAADELLFAKARGERVDSEAENAIYIFLGWDARRQRQEHIRINAVAHHQKTAGTNEEYADAIERLASLNEDTPELIEILTSHIQELQTQLKDAENDLWQASEKVISMENSRAELRGLIPRRIEEHYKSLRENAGIPELEKQRREIKSELAFAKTIARLQHRLRDRTPDRYGQSKEYDAVVETLRTYAPEHVTAKNGTSYYIIRESKAFDDYVAQHAELALELEEQIQDLTIRIENAEAEIESVLDYYIPKKGSK